MRTGRRGIVAGAARLACLAAAGLASGLLTGGLLPALAADRPGEEALWRELAAGGRVVLIRHATAPGGGDPEGFRVDDCATQRNLSEAGRDEARRIGAAFRDRAIPVAAVRSSQWCRCLETARLAFGRADPDPLLNSLHGRGGETAARTAALRARLDAWDGTGGNLVLVTHHANIGPLTGVYPRSGEAVVLRRAGGRPDGAWELAGRLPPP